MHRLAIAALSLIFPFCLFSCASDDDEPIPIDKTGAVQRPTLVGRVASIPSDRKFILIQTYGQWTVPSGTILVTEGSNSRAANLMVTGEASGQYAAADIQSGTIEVGDAVYSRTAPPPGPSSLPVPGPPQPIDTKSTRPF